MATAKLKRKPRLSKFESYKAAHTKNVWFRLKFCVVFAHRYIPGCCCSSFWADMSDVGHDVGSSGCLGSRKCQGPGSSRRFVRQRYHPFSWPNLDTPHASKLLSCRTCLLPCGGWGSGSPPSQMSRLQAKSAAGELAPSHSSYACPKSPPQKNAAWIPAAEAAP
jgi:hypothetical protein